MQRTLLSSQVRPAARMQEIAGAILQEQTPKRLYEVRGKLYELLVNCLPPELILRKLTLELFRCGSCCMGDALGFMVAGAAIGCHRVSRSMWHRRVRRRWCSKRVLCSCWGRLLSGDWIWICLRLNRKLDDELRHKAIDLAALYEHRLQARPWLPSTFAGACLLMLNCQCGFLILPCCAGGIQSHLPFGRVRREVHERVQVMEHHDAGFMTARYFVAM